MHWSEDTLNTYGEEVEVHLCYPLMILEASLFAYPVVETAYQGIDGTH